jgi:hypothetical protein
MGADRPKKGISANMFRDTKNLPPGCKVVHGEGYRRIIYPDGDELTEFYPGHEPKVLTGISEQCGKGECWNCPGIFHLEESGESGDQPVCCKHECHLKTNAEQ